MAYFKKIDEVISNWPAAENCQLRETKLPADLCHLVARANVDRRRGYSYLHIVSAHFKFFGDTRFMGRSHHNVAFSNALRSFQVGGLTRHEFIAEVELLLKRGAVVSDLLAVLDRRELIEPLPPTVRDALIATLLHTPEDLAGPRIALLLQSTSENDTRS